MYNKCCQIFIAPDTCCHVSIGGDIMMTSGEDPPVFHCFYWYIDKCHDTPCEGGLHLWGKSDSIYGDTVKPDVTLTDPNYCTTETFYCIEIHSTC